MNIGGAELSISFTALIIQAYSYCISIIDSKALSIAIIIRLSIDFSGSIVWLYIDRESLSTGTSLYDSTPLVMLGGIPPSMIHEE